jgi:hypothetical protein
MKKLLVGFIILLPVLAIVFVKVRVATSSKLGGPLPGQQVAVAPPLTSGEEADLKRLTDQALSWALLWNTQPSNCLQGDKVAVLDLRKTYEQHRGQQVEMSLVITETNVGVYLAPLHLKLGFLRLKDFGLSPPSTSYFCESTYEEYVAAEKRKVEQQRSVGNQIRERAEADPQISEILKSAEKDSEVPTSKPQEQTRSYKVPDLADQPVAAFDSWSEEKKHLFQRIAAIATGKVEEVFCEAGQTTRVLVPDFDMGEPSIYLLVEPPAGVKSSIDETSILWIQFTRNIATGDYDAYLVKTFGLPDELDWYRPLIEKRKARELKVTCRKKPLR